MHLPLAEEGVALAHAPAEGAQHVVDWTLDPPDDLLGAAQHNLCKSQAYPT